MGLFCRNELKVFFTALMFYTRIPCPKWINHHQDDLNKATRYFPLIGYIVAIVSGITLYLSLLIFSMQISVLLSMIAGILTTGAFHEDGFADVCDGFGGGWTKEKILLIMKDSRLGTFGVIGIIFVLLMKYLCLTHILSIEEGNIYLVILTAHSISRLSAVVMKMSLKYVREDEHSKAKPIAKETTVKDFVIACFFGIAPCFLLGNYFVFLTLIPILLCIAYLKNYFYKWIGGYTGDCLGAVQQLTELVFFFSYISLCKFI